METLSGKVAVVTGGTKGIGRAIAERLLKEGAQVAICGRTRESVEAAVAEMRVLGRVFGAAADVTQLEQVSLLFQHVDQQFGGVDILINNAGAGVFRKVAEMTPEEWRRIIDLDLTAPFYCSREALARFAQRGGGFIVNISSLAAKNPFSGGAAYNAAKAGLNAFTEAMMLDHRHENVRVCSIMPGSVDTGFGHADRREGDRGWMIAPEDVAETAVLVLRMPARTMVSRVEMRPSRPKK
jgi:3-oxoacyl-[acyl-carrier protein] reductase